MRPELRDASRLVECLGLVASGGKGLDVGPLTECSFGGGQRLAVVVKGFGRRLSLEPFLGYRLNQAGVSAIEKTYESERRRNIDAAEIVAFARCFNRPIGWFFLPPVGHADDLVEPVRTTDDRYELRAADLTETGLPWSRHPARRSLVLYMRSNDVRPSSL